MTSTPPTDWRAIPGLDGRYEASSNGEVRSLSTFHKSRTDRILRTFRRKRGGYLTVSIRGEGGRAVNHLVHRLVAAAFIGPCPAGMQVAHGDGDPSNNRPENLRYVTPAENIADRERHGRTVRGSAQSSARLDERGVGIVRRLRGVVSAEDVAHLIGVSPETVFKIWRGEAWKHVE